MGSGRDARRAAAVAWRIFREVYCFPSDAQCTVERSKD